MKLKNLTIMQAHQKMPFYPTSAIWGLLGGFRHKKYNTREKLENWTYDHQQETYKTKLKITDLSLNSDHWNSKLETQIIEPKTRIWNFKLDNWILKPETWKHPESIVFINETWKRTKSETSHISQENQNMMHNAWNIKVLKSE